MKYGELKNMDMYQNADDIYLSVNGEEPVDEMYYPYELDELEVIGLGFDNGELYIDVVCANWNDRNEVGWIALRGDE